jgi:hypothetical protein
VPDKRSSVVQGHPLSASASSLAGRFWQRQYVLDLLPLLNALAALNSTSTGYAAGDGMGRAMRMACKRKVRMMLWLILLWPHHGNER